MPRLKNRADIYFLFVTYVNLGNMWLYFELVFIISLFGSRTMSSCHLNARSDYQQASTRRSRERRSGPQARRLCFWRRLQVACTQSTGRVCLFKSPGVELLTPTAVVSPSLCDRRPWTGNPQAKRNWEVALLLARIHHVPNLDLKRLHYERTAQLWGTTELFLHWKWKMRFVPAAAALLLLCKMKLVFDLEE